MPYIREFDSCVGESLIYKSNDKLPFYLSFEQMFSLITNGTLVVDSYVDGVNYPHTISICLDDSRL